MSYPEAYAHSSDEDDNDDEKSFQQQISKLLTQRQLMYWIMNKLRAYVEEDVEKRLRKVLTFLEDMMDKHDGEFYKFLLKMEDLYGKTDYHEFCHTLWIVEKWPRLDSGPAINHKENSENINNIIDFITFTNRFSKYL